MSKTKVIEIFERTKMVVQIGTDTKGNVVTTTHSVDELRTLNSDYINEHFGDLQDTAYQKGFEDGKAQREHDDKIEVGDEVKPFYTDITGVVTLIDGDTIYVLWRDGSSTSTLKLKEVTKTGRHFDIEKILEEMKHD